MNISDAAREAADALYSELSGLKGDWMHCRSEFLPANVTVDYAGMQNFKNSIARHFNTAAAALTLEMERVKRELELAKEERQFRVGELRAERDQLRQQLETTKEECKALSEALEANIGEKVAEDLGTAQFENDQLRQQLAEAREDSRRLDWLEKHGDHMYGQSFLDCEGEENGWSIGAASEGSDIVNLYGKGPTLRKAIDAALNPPTDEK